MSAQRRHATTHLCFSYSKIGGWRVEVLFLFYILLDDWKKKNSHVSSLRASSCAFCNVILHFCRTLAYFRMFRCTAALLQQDREFKEFVNGTFDESCDERHDTHPLTGRALCSLCAWCQPSGLPALPSFLPNTQSTYACTMGRVGSCKRCKFLL